VEPSENEDIMSVDTVQQDVTYACWGSGACLKSPNPKFPDNWYCDCECPKECDYPGDHTTPRCTEKAAGDCSTLCPKVTCDPDGSGT